MIEFCMSNNFMDGYSHDVVIEMLGNPIREIETGKGVLLFYGSVFIEVVDDAVLFINVSSEDVLESRRLADAKRGIYWGKSIVLVENASHDNRRKMTETEVKEWTERKQRQQEMVIETRVRRFLLTQTFENVLARIPLIEPAALTSGVDKRVNLHNLAANHSTSVIGLKDSRGFPVPAVGESSEYTDRYVSFNESFFAADYLY